MKLQILLITACFFCCILLACTGCKKTFKNKDIGSDNPIKDPIRKNDQLIELDLSILKKGKKGDIDFSTFIEDSYLVFLETTDENLIGNINKIQIADSLMFISDPFIANKLLLYNVNGNFIRQIGNAGGGPGEYIQATDFYYDEIKQEVLVYDQFKSKIIHYNLNGDYIKDDEQFFRYLQFAKIGNEYIHKNLLGNEHISKLNESSLAISTDSIPVKYASLPMLKMDYAGGTLLKIDNETAAYSIPFCDTIYHYQTDLLEAKYYLKIPNHLQLPESFEENVNDSYEKFVRKYGSNKYAYFLGDFLENKSYLEFAE